MKTAGKSMSSKTPFFKAFGPLLFGRPTGRLNSLQELCEISGHLLPDGLLAATEKGTNISS